MTVWVLINKENEPKTVVLTDYSSCMFNSSVYLSYYSRWELSIELFLNTLFFTWHIKKKWTKKTEINFSTLLGIWNKRYCEDKFSLKNDFSLNKIFFFFYIDLTLDQEWTKRIAELESNLEHLQSLYRVKQEDVSILSHYLALTPNATLHNNVMENLSPDTQNAIKNISQKSYLPSTIRLPSISQSFLPHLIQDSDALRPAYLNSKGRKDVSIVLGIPSVKR